MKTIYEHSIGGDGAAAGLYLDGGIIRVSAGFPVAKLSEAVMGAVMPLKAKIEALIPGNFEDGILDKLFDEIGKDITKLLSE